MRAVLRWPLRRSSRTGRTGRAADQGSTIPLILGIFIIAVLMVAGSVTAGDAFVAQNQLQDLCDGAAVAAASTADLDGGRHPGAAGSTFLVLGPAQQAVDRYRERDPDRLAATMLASLSPDDSSVTVQCVETRSVAFGAWFGFGHGVVHHATSTARGKLQEHEAGPA